MIRMWQRSGQNVELSQLQMRILITDCQRLVSEGPWVNIHPPKASPLEGGGGFVMANFQLFDAESKSAKISVSLCSLGGGEKGGVGDGQLPTFDAESKSTKIPKSLCTRGGGGGGGIHDSQLPTFNAESKSAKIPKSLCAQGRGGGFMTANFQLLMPSPNLLKSQIPYAPRKGGGGVENTNFQPVSVLTSCESLGCPTEKWHKNLHSSLSECITDSFPSETN